MKNSNRALESLAPIIHDSKRSGFTYPHKILCSPSDVGVMINNGKNGARYAPTAIINHLKKQNNHLKLQQNEAILITEVTNQNKDQSHLELAQQNASREILSELETEKVTRICHLGGGHDHVYPLLMAINENTNFDNIFILNIDAHCDTRIDEKHHSGTPFRDFDKNAKKPFHLVQYGIHDFANSTSTLSNLSFGSEKKIFLPEVEKMSSGFQNIPQEIFKDCPFEITDRTAVILSIDCDGIDGSQMKAVSCVNTTGVPLIHLIKLLQELKLNTNNNLILGVYEFNPVYDDLTIYGAKSIVHILYEYLK